MESALEQTRYWMWARRKLMCGSPYGSDSWEEQAFAADADGCTWPPRSYSCSFCRREFRSAQALGGHMNVHRRDRARLKACSPPAPPVEEAGVGQTSHHLRDHLPLVRNPNPNCEVAARSPPPPPLPSLRVKGGDEKARLQCKRSFISTEGPFDLRLGMDGSNLTKRKRDCCDVEVKDGVFLSGKRQRFDPPVNDCDRRISTVSELCHSPREELDLELRLGNPAKVK